MITRKIESTKLENEFENIFSFNIEEAEDTITQHEYHHNHNHNHNSSITQINNNYLTACDHIITPVPQTPITPITPSTKAIIQSLIQETINHIFDLFETSKKSYKIPDGMYIYIKCENHDLPI